MATIYRAGIIGLARMGSWWDDQLRETTPVEVPSSHAGMYSACPRTELVAGCDLDAEKRETFRRRWGVAAVYADYREMLARESLDVVSVVTSWASVQGAIAADVAASGVKGMYCEKPMASSVEQMSRIVDLCRERHVAVVVPYVRRYNPRYGKVRELVTSGAIGQLRTIHATAVASLLHAGTHYFDIMNFLSGDPEPAWCSGRLEDTSHLKPESWARQDPSGSGYFEMRDGTRFTFDGASSGPATFLLSGTEGRLWVLNEARDILLSRTNGGTPDTITSPAQTQSVMYAGLEDLVQAMDGGATTRCNAEQAARTLEMALAVHESQRTGNGRVDFPLQNPSLSVDTW
ncbi:MAG TPA: Gfo/Idh/MocA family oxidoreductase [Chloroflexota bacterium]|jgi:predicted dehydrogenase